MAMLLELESGEKREVAVAKDISNALWRLNPDGPDTFAILSSSADHYVQTSASGKGYVVEKREGSADAHWMAARPDRNAKESRVGEWWQIWKQPRYDHFDLAETEEIFAAYLERRSSPAFLKWVKLEFPER